MFSFFERSMVGVRDVLRSQLEMAESKGHRVEKVVLTGGFGQSPSLQTYLRDFLKEHSASSGRDIDLVVPQNP